MNKDMNMAKRNTLMSDMVSAAGMLKSSKLKVNETGEAIVEAIRQKALLATEEEAIAMVAIFDRQCSDKLSNLDDMTDYFQCSAIESMSLFPAFESLFTKGYTTTLNLKCRCRQVSFKLREDIFRAIIEGRELSPSVQKEKAPLDQFGFCAEVRSLIQERSEECINTDELFSLVDRKEEEHGDIAMISDVKELLTDTAARTLFYAMCHDFSNSFNGGTTYLNDLLDNIYDTLLEGAKVLNDFKNDRHPLVKTGLARLTFDNDNFGRRAKDTLKLTDQGLKIYLRDVANAFIKDFSCADRYEFVAKVEGEIEEMPRQTRRRNFVELYSEIERVEESNAQLSFVANVQKLLRETDDRLLFYCVCGSMLSSSSFRLGNLDSIFSRGKGMTVRRELMAKNHKLQKLKLVELTKGAFFSEATLMLTKKGKELFLEEDAALFEEKVVDSSLVGNAAIAEKRLFFEPAMEEQLTMLRESLEDSNLSALCERLRSNNMPTGIAALLYGCPGTGKTESVMQIARATGRDVMHVDISQTKSCWFGESEKKIKEVFDKYRQICKRSKVKPILLFNEADAVFSKRKDANSGNLAQTENAIQNIILEEMENLDGILIATTNLADNLDKAFERRFLFKIRFDKPTVESKIHIWMDKLPRLGKAEASQLAAAFDFSGGEIDNIVRKALMEEVISGNVPDMERMMALCRDEKMTAKGNRVGF